MRRHAATARGGALLGCVAGLVAAALNGLPAAPAHPSALRMPEIVPASPGPVPIPELAPLSPPPVSIPHVGGDDGTVPFDELLPRRR